MFATCDAVIEVIQSLIQAEPPTFEDALKVVEATHGGHLVLGATLPQLLSTLTIKDLLKLGAALEKLQ